MCMSAWVYAMFVCGATKTRRGHHINFPGVTYSYNLTDVDTGNWTWALWKENLYSLCLHHLSSLTETILYDCFHLDFVCRKAQNYFLHERVQIYNESAKERSMKQMMRMKITYRSHVLMTGTCHRSPVPEAALCIILLKSPFNCSPSCFFWTPTSSYAFYYSNEALKV